MALRRREADNQPAGSAPSLENYFQDWLEAFPFRRPPWLDRAWPADDLIRVDEYHENGMQVIKADLAGVDPEKDIDLTVSGGMLQIAAERHHEEQTEEKGYVRREIRSGSFRRNLPLPPGVAEDDITATYDDGILEVRYPIPETGQGKKVPIKKG